MTFNIKPEQQSKIDNRPKSGKGVPCDQSFLTFPVHPQYYLLLLILQSSLGHPGAATSTVHLRVVTQCEAECDGGLLVHCPVCPFWIH